MQNDCSPSSETTPSEKGSSVPSRLFFRISVLNFRFWLPHDSLLLPANERRSRLERRIKWQTRTPSEPSSRAKVERARRLARDTRATTTTARTATLTRPRNEALTPKPRLSRGNRYLERNRTWIRRSRRVSQPSHQRQPRNGRYWRIGSRNRCLIP